MTTYAPTFTPRFRGKYVAAGLTHTIMVRGPRGATFADMQTRGNTLNGVFNHFAAILAIDFAWISADIALTDSDVFTPATVPSPTVGTITLATFTPTRKIGALTFSGRALGSKARFSLYGLNIQSDVSGGIAQDFVIRASELTAVSQTVIDANNFYFANSGQAATWYAQATYKPNDFLMKKVRRGLIT